MRVVNNFHLTKWFLDFIGPSGEVMIFYSARLRWLIWEVQYASWLHYDPNVGVTVQSKLSNVNSPNLDPNTKKIEWNDDDFKVKGIWQSESKSIQSRLYESKKRYLDWNCYQPKSKVELWLKNPDRHLLGRGYAEELVMIIPPWRLPMDELRWGHYCDDDNSVVWIQMKAERDTKWLWFNGEFENNSVLTDSLITMSLKNIQISLKKLATLEAEKKISAVFNDLLRYIPIKLKKIVPLKFLSADEFKWFSSATLYKDNSKLAEGISIHEYVKFK